MHHAILTPHSPAVDICPSTTHLTSHAEYIHNFSNIAWDSENEPPSTNQLYYLLTITGLLIVATYPANHTLGEHYIAWAPLSDQPTLQLH
jgi:hypothetical protein